MRIRAALVVGVAAAALAGPPSSQATVTIGPNLAALTPAPIGYDCSDTHECTLVNGSVGAALGSPPLVSPVTGSITRLRVRTGPGGANGIIFRMLHPVGDGTYKAEISFGVVPPSLPPNSTTEFPAFPIQAGEAIGVDCCRGGFDNITSATVTGSGSFLAWGTGGNPFFESNETRAPDSTQTDQLLMLNADVEPINGFGVTKTKLKGAKVKATATVFNPGVLTATGKLFRPTTVNVDVPIRGGPPVPSTDVRMVIKPKKSKRAHVRRASKAMLRIAYTPIFGTTSTSKVLVER
jgi:hypothetical protein